MGCAFYNTLNKGYSGTPPLAHGVSLSARAPATCANLGPGFDIFGLALAEPFDVVKVSKTEGRGITLSIRGYASDTIPLRVEENSAGLAAKTLLDELNLDVGLHIEVEKGVKPGMGLGSSAASAVASVYAINSLLNLNLPKRDLIRFSAEGEKASAGVAHMDNVSAALLGGFTIVNHQTQDAIRINPPEELAICIAEPDIKPPPKKTGLARSILPKRISLDRFVYNTSMACWMIAALTKGDIYEMGRAMLDRVVEPIRAEMIPGYKEVKRRAL